MQRCCTADPVSASTTLLCPTMHQTTCTGWMNSFLFTCAMLSQPGPAQPQQPCAHVLLLLGLECHFTICQKLQEWACGLLHADHEASDHAMVMLGDNALANQPLGSRQRHTTSPQLLPNMLQQLACVEHSCALGMWQPHPPPRSHLHSSTIWTVAALTFLEITPHFCKHYYRCQTKLQHSWSCSRAF